MPAHMGGKRSREPARCASIPLLTPTPGTVSSGLADFLCDRRAPHALACTVHASYLSHDVIKVAGTAVPPRAVRTLRPRNLNSRSSFFTSNSLRWLPCNSASAWITGPAASRTWRSRRCAPGTRT